ncbi:MAG: elongation factor 1-beta [Candidatus Woesearchaeota archaeon]
MARVVVTVTINPESPDVDLKKIEEEAKGKIEKSGADYGRTELEPIGFGLKAVKIIFIMDESKGVPDELVDDIAKLKGVASARITDVRRTIG